MLNLSTPKKTKTPPPARNLARMMALTKKNNLPPFAAEMLATMMTPETAEQVEADLVSAFEFADAMKVSLEADLKPLLQQALDAFSEEEHNDDANEAPITAHLASVINAKKRADNPMTGIHMRGASRAEMGQDWNSPQAVRAKMADVFATRLAPRLGLQHEPTVGRDLANLTIPQMAVQTLIAAGERPMSEAEAVRIVMAGTHTGSDFPAAIESGW